MFCEQCGRSIDSDSRFCVFCGAPSNKEAKASGLSDIKKAVNSIAKAYSAAAGSACVFATDGTKIDMNGIYADYDLTGMKKIDNNFYILLGENRQKAVRDIMYLNLYLAEAPKRYRTFPLNQIRAEQVRFIKTNSGVRDYCILSISPLTKTGKKPKFPVSLHFNITDKLFGEIFYGQGGEIDKVDVVSWGSGICYELKLSLINDNLDINAIYKTNPVTFKKQKMYSA